MDMLEAYKSILMTGMYCPNHIWKKYKELKIKYPSIRTGYITKDWIEFMKLEGQPL